MIDRRRSLTEDGRVESESDPGRQKQIGQKLTQQYRPIAVPAIAAAMPYQDQQKNEAPASRHKKRAPSETD
jgi:hypothetical protein